MTGVQTCALPILSVGPDKILTGDSGALDENAEHYDLYPSETEFTDASKDLKNEYSAKNETNAGNIYLSGP